MLLGEAGRMLKSILGTIQTTYQQLEKTMLQQYKTKKSGNGRIRSFLAGMLVAAALATAQNSVLNAETTCPTNAQIIEEELTLLLDGEGLAAAMVKPQIKPNR